MQALTIISIAIVLVSTISAASFESSKAEVEGFTYLGTSKQVGGSKAFEPNDYYASAASGIWTQAQDDCQKSFGRNGHLVSLETVQEQEDINRWLQERGSGGAIFWTGGQYDMLTEVWKWTATGTNITETRWGPEEPKNLNGRQRIGLNHQNQFTSFWITVDDSNLERYICEVHHVET